MPADAPKHDLITQLLGQLQGELRTARERAREAAEAATHEENRPENAKDMRSTEASYVARGQAAHVRELELALGALSQLRLRPFGPEEAIALSALVEVESSGQRATYLLVPSLGGRRLQSPAGPVSTLTPESPLGRALLGLLEGESAVVPAPQGQRSVEVLAVR